MTVRTLIGDCRTILPTLAADSFDCIVTSPPYWGLRDYGCAGQIGLESEIAGYVEAMRQVGAELRRVLKPTGTFWLNLGDSYAGGKTGRDDNSPADLARRSAAYGTGGGEGCGPKTGKARKPTDGLKPKDLCLVPERVAMALQADGWFLRSQIIWHKPNPMPESVTDRPTSAHERVFLLTKSERYFYDAAAIAEPAARAGDWNCANPPTDAPYAMNRRVQVGDTRNARNVWTIASQPYSGAHFATMPPALVERCVLAGCPKGGHVLDPFGGAGTTGLVAGRLQRNATLIELNPAYVDLQTERIVADGPLFADVI